MASVAYDTQVNTRPVRRGAVAGALGVCLASAIVASCDADLNVLNPDRHREIRGVIGPSEGGGEACVGLMGDDGTWYNTLWPEGWRVVPAPAEIIAPDGSTFAVAGDTVVVDGQLSTEGKGPCPGTPLEVESARRTGAVDAARSVPETTESATVRWRGCDRPSAPVASRQTVAGPPDVRVSGAIGAPSPGASCPASLQATGVFYPPSRSAAGPRPSRCRDQQ